jgi:hypothetical protein
LRRGPDCATYADDVQLYDLAVDPSEKTDLAAKHPEILNRMKAEFETWHASVQRSCRGDDYNGKPSLKS